MVTGDKEDIIQKVKAIVSTYKSIYIAFTDISISTTYHQYIFARVKPISSLLDAHIELQEILAYSVKDMYVPHMSLVYGDISSSEKSKIADEITLNTTNFKADRLCIVNADNLDPKTWLHVSEFELSN